MSLQHRTEAHATCSGSWPCATSPSGPDRTRLPAIPATATDPQGLAQELLLIERQEGLRGRERAAGAVGQRSRRRRRRHRWGVAEVYRQAAGEVAPSAGHAGLQISHRPCCVGRALVVLLRCTQSSPGSLLGAGQRVCGCLGPWGERRRAAGMTGQRVGVSVRRGSFVPRGRGGGAYRPVSTVGDGGVHGGVHGFGGRILLCLNT